MYGCTNMFVSTLADHVHILVCSCYQVFFRSLNIIFLNNLISDSVANIESDAQMHLKE